MIPVPDEEINKIDFRKIAVRDSKYADLLRAEYAYCSAHEEDIRNKAESVYKIGCNKKHVLNHVCCDFQLLENKCALYKK